MATHDAASNPSSAKAFTLTEMLIVIALIALLLSIVLPSIGRGRELARRTVCRANLGALASAMTAYAQDNKDRVPLACRREGASGALYRSEGYAISYEIVSDSNGVIQPEGHLGLLTRPGQEYVSSPEQFYCPSNGDPDFEYNSADNPWFDNDSRSSESPVPWTRAGYTTRPVVGWIEGGGLAWNGPPAPSKNNGIKLPKMMNFNAGEAMIADIIDYPGVLDRHHKTGVNVVRFDGSAIWFDEKGFNEQQPPEYKPNWNGLDASNYEANNKVFYERDEKDESLRMDSRTTNYKGKCAWHLMGK